VNYARNMTANTMKFVSVHMTNNVSIFKK